MKNSPPPPEDPEHTRWEPARAVGLIVLFVLAIAGIGALEGLVQK